jgi:hypothetical protein
MVLKFQLRRLYSFIQSGDKGMSDCGVTTAPNAYPCGPVELRKVSYLFLQKWLFLVKVWAF